MYCATIVFYSVLVNGQPGSVFKPIRGLCQGDPISLYLYLIWVVGLSTLLNEVENTNKIRGVKVAKGSPTINHLCFADDNIIFFRANSREWQEI